MRTSIRHGRRLVAVCGAAAIATSMLGAPTALAQPGADPSEVGAMSEPFEEGGAGQPACEVKTGPTTGEEGRIVCKPAAVSTAMLPTGNLLYWMGIESQENVENSIALEGGQMRDDQTRLLDMNSGTAEWSVPGDPNGGGVNPEIEPGRGRMDCVTEEPLGVAGVPDRPDDGFVGSLAGAAGVPEQNPASAPDDPAANDVAMFCADVVTLADGRPLVIGGTDWYNEPAILERNEGDPIDVGVIELEGLRTTRTYDYDANTWNNAGAMKYGRWYPGPVTMPNGEVFVASGTRKLIKSTQGSQVRRTENYNPETDTWRENFSGPASENTLPQNPRLFVAPNGKVIYTGDGQMWGPLGQAVDEVLYGLQQFWNPEAMEWEVSGATIPRSSPATTPLPLKAPYDEMRILRAGGTLGPPPGTYLAQPTAEVMTVRGDSVSTAPTGLLNNPRWFSSAVQLPDGKVLITGGSRVDEVINPGFDFPVREQEIYDPETGEFTPAGSTTRDRTYHNSAVLLPDGRVLIGGNRQITAGYTVQSDVLPGVTSNNDGDPSFEIYSPPYLFNGERPEIDRVQSGIKWGERFAIETDDAESIEKVSLVKLSSPQHVIDSDARTIELPFTSDGNTVTAEAPPNGNIATPGAYFVFINKKGDDGENLVPSVGHVAFVGDESNSEPAIAPMNGDPVDGGSATPVEDVTLLEEPPSILPQCPVETAPGTCTPPGDGTTPEDGDAPSGDMLPEGLTPPEGILPGVAPSGSGRRHHHHHRLPAPALR